MATYSSILAWEIPQTEEPGGLQSTGHEESDMTEQLHHHHHTHTELRNITDTESSSPHTHWIPITTSPPSGGLASSWTLSVTVKSLQLILFRVEWYALKLCEMKCLGKEQRSFPGWGNTIAVVLEMWNWLCWRYLGKGSQGSFVGEKLSKNQSEGHGHVVGTPSGLASPFINNRLWVESSDVLR